MATLTLRLEAYEGDAREAIRAAQALADDRGHPEVEPLHLLHDLVGKDDGVREAIRRAGVDPVDVLLEAELRLRKTVRNERGGPSYLSPRMLDLLGRAEGEAARQGGRPVDVDDLFLAAAQESTGAVKEVLRACGLSAPVLRATLGGAAVEDPADVRGEDRTADPGLGGRAPSPAGGSREGDGRGDRVTGRKGGAGRRRSRGAASREPEGDPLERFGRDLTRLAAQGKLDPVVGRDGELRRILQVLARRRENHPVLVGEPGIGKTAIVHGLAQRIARGDVPGMLQDKRLVALDFGNLVAGARLRGELEERVRALLDAVRDSGGEVLLVLPGLAPLLGSQSAGAAGILSGALGRGEIRAIATASNDDWRKATDDESGLSRRFVPVPVDAPSPEEALAILRGVVGRFEIAHGVRIADPSLGAAVTFARRYLPSNQLPKSAIDLMDEAAARVRVEMDSVPAELDRLERRLENLEMQRASLEDDHDDASVRAREELTREAADLGPRVAELRERWQAQLDRLGEVRRLKEELAAARREHEQARAADDTGRAGELRFGTIPLLDKQLDQAEQALAEVGAPLVRDTVTPGDVADVVAATTGIPVSKMLEEETDKLLRMEERLRERVIGQDEAVVAVSKAVRRGRVGLRDPRRPIGSFLFLGPTGVGKTELAKALAEFLFDDETALTRLDMSEFMEKHMVARLLGSPPGYVDSDEGGYLTEAVRRKPYSVVLFDEMEKAHPDVFNILLQVLDDGRLTDSRGRPATFADTVIIMTSNVGGRAILEHEGSDESLREVIDTHLFDAFRPEFLNRVDETILFRALDREDLRGIVDIQLRGLGRLLAHRDLGLAVSDGAKARLVELGYDPAFGARPLKRVILKHLQDPLAEAILRGGYGAGETVRVDVDGEGAFTFEGAQPKVVSAAGQAE